MSSACLVPSMSSAARGRSTGGLSASRTRSPYRRRLGAAATRPTAMSRPQCARRTSPVPRPAAPGPPRTAAHSRARAHRQAGLARAHADDPDPTHAETRMHTRSSPRRRANIVLQAWSWISLGVRRKVQHGHHQRQLSPRPIPVSAGVQTGIQIGWPTGTQMDAHDQRSQVRRVPNQLTNFARPISRRSGRAARPPVLRRVLARNRAISSGLRSIASMSSAWLGISSSS